MNEVFDAVEATKVLAAIDVIQQFLRKHYIVEECRNDRMFGCASCAAIEADAQLEGLRHSIENDEGHWRAKATSALEEFEREGGVSFDDLKRELGIGEVRDR